MLRRPPRSTLLPHTTRVRSCSAPPSATCTPWTAPATAWPPAGSESLSSNYVAYWADFTCTRAAGGGGVRTRLNRAELARSEEHTSELQSRQYLVCRLPLERR